MAKLTGPEIKELQQALLDSFNRQDLKQLLLALDKDFDRIVPDSSTLPAAVLSIVQTAERADPRWTADLLQAAARQRPDVAPLQQTIQRLLDRVAAPEERPDCPYPGMVPFTANDARFFYGREDEIEKMLRRLRGQRLLFVIGSSGSGKSSLIAAGLLPNLAKSKLFPAKYWVVRTMRPGADPMETLAEALGGDPAQPDAAVAALLAANPGAGRLLLVIDQFEELFSLAEAEERKQFIAVIQALRKSDQCVLLIAMRADFYPDLMNSDLWPVDASQRLEVTPLRGDALKQAIVKPADQRDVQVEDALVERLLADASDEPGSLPMLQETLVLLWARMVDHHLTLDAYEKLGEGGRNGLTVAIAAKADQVLLDPSRRGDPALASLSYEERESTVRRIFLRLIQFGEGRADTRRQQSESALRNAGEDSEVLEKVLDELAHNRLLTLSGGEEKGSERQVDISHEALIKGWPRLQEWVARHKEAEQTRRRLETKVQDWVRLGRGEGGLLDAIEMKEAIAWQTDPSVTELGVSDDLSALIAASRKAVNPGWNRWGTLNLLVSGVALAFLLAAAYFWLQWSRTPGTARLPLIIFLTSLVVLALLAFVQGRRSDPFLLQRLSHSVGQPRFLIGSAGVFAVAVIIGVSQAIPRVSTDNFCIGKGYEKDTPYITIATITEGVGQREMELFGQALSRMSRGDLMAHLAMLEDALKCKDFFRYRLILQSRPDTGRIETKYIAEIHESRSDEPIGVSVEVSGRESCGAFVALAARVVDKLGHSNYVFPIDYIVATPADCSPYLDREEGLVALWQEHYEAAERHFRDAIAVDSSYAQAHASLGLLYYRELKYDQAIAELESSASLAPTDWWSRYTLVVIHRKLGNYGEAHAYLHEVEPLLPLIQDETQRRTVDLQLQEDAGILAFQEGDYPKAITLLKQVIEAGGGNKEDIVYFLAKSYQQQGLTREACGVWKQYEQIPYSEQLLDAEQRRREDARRQTQVLDCS